MWSLFTETLEVDNRTPCFIFDFLPNGSKYGLLCPSLSFWVQFYVYVGFVGITSVFLALIVYYFIVKQRKSTTAFLVGYGIVLPCTVVLPHLFINLLGVRNMPIVMGLCAIPILDFFRCLAAMYGFSPPVVEKNVLYFCIYYVAPVEFVFDLKTQLPIRSKEQTDQKSLFSLFRFTLSSIVIGSILHSWLEPLDYMPFSTNVIRNQSSFTIFDLFGLGHMANNFFVGCMTHADLSLAGSAFGAACSLFTGYLVKPIGVDPVLGSKSPSDFWGRQWNNLVHSALKMGVYKPVRFYTSKATALIATFMASGLIHEYLLYSFALASNKLALQNDSNISNNNNNNNDDCSNCFVPNYGIQTMFFAWNALILFIEYHIGNHSIFHLMDQHLPSLLKTALLSLLILPFIQWFTYEYLAASFYSHFMLGLPIIVQI